MGAGVDRRHLPACSLMGMARRSGGAVPACRSTDNVRLGDLTSHMSAEDLAQFGAGADMALFS